MLDLSQVVDRRGGRERACNQAEINDALDLDAMLDQIDHPSTPGPPPDDCAPR